jgi:hypothetical protein
MQRQSSSLIGMGYGRKSFAAYVGLRSICGMAACMSIELRAELKAFIRCIDLSFGPYDLYNRDRRMYSLPKQERQ